MSFILKIILKMIYLSCSIELVLLPSAVPRLTSLNACPFARKELASMILYLYLVFCISNSCIFVFCICKCPHQSHCCRRSVQHDFVKFVAQMKNRYHGVAPPMKSWCISLWYNHRVAISLNLGKKLIPESQCCQFSRDFPHFCCFLRVTQQIGWSLGNLWCFIASRWWWWEKYWTCI